MCTYCYSCFFIVYGTLNAKSQKEQKGQTVGEGTDSTKVRGGVLWDSGADFRAIVRILPMAKKTPKKGPPDPQKGPPDPPKRTPQRVPQKTPKAKGEGCGGGSDLGGFGARTAVYIYYGG